MGGFILAPDLLSGCECQWSSLFARAREVLLMFVVLGMRLRRRLAVERARERVWSECGASAW